MAIAPEFLPGPQAGEAGGGDPFGGLAYGAPDGFGDQQSQVPSRLPGDLYPEDDEEYDKLLKWCQSAFTASESARHSYEERWAKYYRLYRSYIQREAGDWHSTVFIPICFWIIETIAPRLVAQLPKFVAYPIGPEDVDPAKHMEQLLDWASKESGLYIQLVAAFKSALKYGTGILKTYHRQDLRRARRMMPIDAPLTETIQEPVVDENGQPYVDFDGQPIVETREVEVGRLPLGMQSQSYQYVAYDGPAAECIDIFNFWPAPEAYDIDSARYVIHRTYRPWSYVQRRIEEGIYHQPVELSPEQILNVEDNPALKRLSSIGLGSQSNPDPTLQQVELLEFWTDDGRVMTMANRKCLLRVQENPFDHAEKPFIRIVDYYQEHEFWGVGEIEPLEGLQDVHNAITNSRIDNLRLVLNAMFYVNPSHVEDLQDFIMRPGGIVRGKGDVKREEVFERIDLGDVTGNAFNETELLERTVEKVSGVSAYQMGLDAPSLNETATGTAIIQEQGASRFGMKSKLIELMGLKALGRQFASILQQFTSDEKIVRMTGPTGQISFETFTPEAIHGALDVDIEAESTTQSQTMRVEQKQTLLQLVAEFAPQGVYAALAELLEAMGIKDKEKFIYGDPNDPLSQAMLANQMMMMTGGMMGGGPEGMGPPGMMGPGGQEMPPAPPGQIPDEEIQPRPGEGTPGQMQADMAQQQLMQDYERQAGYPAR